MLCVTLNSYNAPCSAVSGGVSNIWLFDPEDFNFTQDNVTKSYTAISLRPSSTGNLYPIKFEKKEAEYKFKHSRNGRVVKYEHTLDARLPKLSQEITNFLKELDDAGVCCGLGVIFRDNNGKIFVIGEKFVNTEEITDFEILMDGSEGGTGKKLEEFNGATVMFKGDYSRAANEFTGGMSVLVGFQ